MRYPPSLKRLVFSPRWCSRTYLPLFCTDLLAGTGWASMTSNSTSDNGSERTVTDLDPAGNGKFYRIQISVP